MSLYRIPVDFVTLTKSIINVKLKIRDVKGKDGGRPGTLSGCGT